MDLRALMEVATASDRAQTKESVRFISERGYDRGHCGAEIISITLSDGHWLIWVRPMHSEHSNRSLTRSMKATKRTGEVFGNQAPSWEPPVGIEPTTCSLRETRPPAPVALPARMARRNALIAQDAQVAHTTRSTTRSTRRADPRLKGLTTRNGEAGDSVPSQDLARH
jgi:hypothetical protein